MEYIVETDTINHASVNNVRRVKRREELEKEIKEVNLDNKKECKNSFSYFPENFVPKLKPKKSTIIPSSLILNKEEKNEHKENGNITEKDIYSSSDKDSISSSIKYEDDSEDSSDLEGEDNKEVNYKENKEDIDVDEETKFEQLQKESLSFYKNKNQKNQINSINNGFKDMVEFNSKKEKNGKSENNNNIVDSNKITYSTNSPIKNKPLLIRDVLLNFRKKK